MRISIIVAGADTEVSSDFIPLEVFPEMSLDDVKGFVEAEINIKPSAQRYVLNGQVITQTSRSLTDLGVNDGDMINLFVQTRPQNATSRNQENVPRQQPAQQSSNQPDPENPETFRQSILANADLRQRIRFTAPDLDEVIDDPQEFARRFASRGQRQREAAEEMQRLHETIARDPFNVEAQAKIIEMYRQEKVAANMRKAYEENPAAFGSITMLYVDVLVNDVPIKAFVDSGAQSTILDLAAAEKCGIADLIDKKAAGFARGVGTGRILGRIHHADIQLGQYSLAATFQVMEIKGIDMLLGLDMLRRHQMCIDLKKNCLRVESTEIPFLSESEIPKYIHDDDEQVMEELKKQAGASVVPAATSSSSAQSSTVSEPQALRSGINIHPIGSTGNINSPRSAAAPAQNQQQQPPPPSPPPPQQQQQQPGGSFGGSTPITENMIAQITEKGFSRQEAIFALQQANGNVELALGLLF